MASEPRPQSKSHGNKEPSNGPTISLTSRASWVFLARLSSFVFAIILPLILTRQLSQEDYGVYKVVFLVVSMASAMLPLGMNIGAFYFLSREGEDRKATILNILLFLATAGTLGGGAVSLFPETLTFITGDDSIESLAPWVGLLIAFWVVGMFLEVAPIANQEPRLGSMLMLATSLTRTGMFVSSALVFATVPALIFAALLQIVVQIVVLLVYLARRFPGFWKAFDQQLLRRQLSYALPFGAAGLLYILQTDVHNYFVSHEFGPAVFAIYSIGCLQMPLVGMLTEAAASVLLPRIVELRSDDDTEGIIQVTMRAARKMSVAFLPIYGLLTVMGEEVITLLFTERYLASLPIFRINLLMLLFNFLPTDPIMRAYPQYRYPMLVLMAAVVFVLMGTLAWITPVFGTVGVISIVVFVRFIVRLIVVIGLARALGFGRAHGCLFRDIGKAAIAAAAAMLVAGLLRWALADFGSITRLTVCGTAFATAYATMLFVQRVPEKDEVALVRRILLKPFYIARRAI